jgi:hypothetical protein
MTKPTKKQVKDAVKVLSQGDVIGACEAILLAAGCSCIVIAGRTKMRNGFVMTNKTDRFIRGMVRKALKADIEAENEHARAVAAEESAREDQWFEQRNTPRW